MLKVVLVGKPNVGKSTIFNRIIEKKKSIVSAIAGTTRDRIYSEATWLNKQFILIDTGGLTNQNQPFKANIEQQVQFALDEADIILFIVSYKDGINNEDAYVAKCLKKYKGKKIWLVANKSETNDFHIDHQLVNFGFGKPFYISAEHGIGLGDLLDKIILIKPAVLSDQTDKHVKFCIIGRTNVGKSTLMNAILNKERVVVSSIEHTTRDSINEDFYYNKEKYTIIDTAGIRRKGRITNEIEKYAILRTELAIKESNMILLMLDGSEPFNEQDEVIAGLAYQANIPTIICVNKFDLVKKSNRTNDEFTDLIRKKFKFLTWAPIIFISAKNKEKINKLFETIKMIQSQLAIKVNTKLLNSILMKAQIANPSPKIKGGRLSINYAVQIKSQIPTFVIFVNKPEFLHFTYARYIENQIRHAFGINYVPITVYYKDKNARIRSE
ncbi:MAG: ribosome biogenesis GTPase Der [Mycoplasmataceae bacterium]|nr:ribosome biogenesis GTPase Der [Mycoplasmataceae bacterium]